MTLRRGLHQHWCSHPCGAEPRLQIRSVTFWNKDLSMSQTTQPAFTITMFADQTATVEFDYVVPAGGLTPPPAATYTPDQANLAEVTPGPVTSDNGTPPSFKQTVTIIGAGTAGTTVLRAFEGGVDNSDIQLVLNARPLDTGSFNPTSVVITDTAPAQQTQPQTQTLAAGPTKVNG